MINPPHSRIGLLKRKLRRFKYRRAVIVAGVIYVIFEIARGYVNGTFPVRP